MVFYNSGDTPDTPEEKLRKLERVPRRRARGGAVLVRREIMFLSLRINAGENGQGKDAGPKIIAEPHVVGSVCEVFVQIRGDRPGFGEQVDSQ